MMQNELEMKKFHVVLRWTRTELTGQNNKHIPLLLGIFTKSAERAVYDKY